MNTKPKTMKKIVAIFSLSLFLFSCEKDGLFNHHDKNKPCPVVAAEAVPVKVKTTFETKYPATTVTTWFNKDNNSYCALFTANGRQERAFFDNDGNFRNEEIEGDNNNNNHQDNNQDGCDCDTEHDD